MEDTTTSEIHLDTACLCTEAKLTLVLMLPGEDAMLVLELTLSSGDLTEEELDSQDTH